MWPKIARLFAALVLLKLSIVAQTSDTSPALQQPGSKPQFFAGTVTALNNQEITVSRTPVGHSPEHRTFLINAKTKVNKAALKLKSRVTVKYQHLADGDVALEIQPQPLVRSPKPS